MDLCRFPFHLLSVFKTCIIFVYFNLLISSSSVNSAKVQSMMNDEIYGHISESGVYLEPVTRQETFQKSIKNFRGFVETPKTGRQKREEAPSTFDLCQDSSVDAATTTGDGKTYFFKGNYYWRLTGVEEIRMEYGYPRKISEDWEGLPGNLDAALTWVDHKTFFFKENQYWRFKNQKMDSGYPKAISDGFTGIPNSVDAAFLWNGNKKTYFFKGSEYWQYQYSADPPSNTSYPLPINLWEGVPNNIDAALRWSNNITYFFKGTTYYRFDDRISSVVKDDPAGPYPRPTNVWWFGCQKQFASTEVSLNGGDKHPTHIDGEEKISTSTQLHMENDHRKNSEKSDIDQKQNGDDDLATLSPENQLPDTNSAASACASLFISFLLVAVL